MGELNKRNIISRNFGGGGNSQLIGCQDVWRSSLYNKRTLSNYTNIFLNENSLPSCPLNFLSSDNQSVGNASLIAPYSCHPELVSDSNEMQKQRGQSDVQHDMTNYPLLQSLPSGGVSKTGFTLYSSLKRNAAFTLAEVLITLGIIGIVAAMTMPSLIAKHQEKVLIVSARKAFSTVLNATKLAQSQNGVIGDNTFLFDPSKTSAEVAQNFAQYFNGAKVCPSKTSPGCSQYFYDRTKYSTSGYGDAFSGKCPLILLPDGSVLAINQLTSCAQATFICDAIDPATGNCTKDDEGNSLGSIATLHFCASISIDVNGPKAPNQYGRDVYSGRVWQNGKITFNDWGQTGAGSARNILMGVDKLIFKKF